MILYEARPNGILRAHNVDPELLNAKRHNRSRTTDTRLEAKLDRQIQACSKSQNMIISPMGARPSATFENCTTPARNAPTIEGRREIVAHRRARIYIGNDENGRPIYQQVSGRTETERNDRIVRTYIASGRIKEFLSVEDLQRLGLVTNGQSISVESQPRETKPKTDFCRFAWDCFNRYKVPKLTNKGTLATQKTAFNSFTKYFDGRFVEDIETADVQAWLNARASGGLVKKSVTLQRSLLAWVLDIAIEQGLISKNPARSKLLVNAGQDSEGTQVIPLDEHRRLVQQISKIEDPRKQLLIALLALTGMRREEVLGLQWQDIDFESNPKMIHVVRARVCMNNRFVDKPPKSRAGDRQIPISNTLLDCLLKHKKDGGYVITVDGATPFETNNSYRKFYKETMAELEATGITARMYRTTYATRQAGNGMEPKTLQGIMGHSDFDMTFNVYAKLDQSRLGSHANDIDEILGV